MVYGPLSDRFGRRPMLYAGLAVYVVSGTAAAFVPSLTGLLPVSRRRSVAPAALLQAFGAVVRNRQTAGFALVVTCLLGIMTSFIGSFEIILSDVYDQEQAFPVIFGVLSTTLGAGALLSARLVVQVGLDRLLRGTAAYLLVVALSLAAVALLTDGRPPLWAFVLLLGGLLPAMTVLLPNSNTAAMAPLAHVAGMASAVIGTISTAGGALLGSRIDVAFDGTVKPFAYGAACFAVVAAGTIFALGSPVRATAPEPAA